MRKCNQLRSLARSSNSANLTKAREKFLTKESKMKATLGYLLVLCLLHAVSRPYINLTHVVQRGIARLFFPAPGNGTSYDFVVVGAGAAGSTVAGRLAQHGNYSVLLLEAGGPSHWMMGVPFFMPAFLVGLGWFDNNV